jgi:site-specific recombinase XerD
MERFCWWLEHEQQTAPTLSALTPANIRAYLSYARRGCATGRYGSDHPAAAREARPATVATYFRVLRAFANFCLADGLLEETPFKNVGPPRVPVDQVQPFASEQVQALLDAVRRGRAPERDVALILVLVDTGMRVSELCSLTVGEVDRGTGEFRVTGKGNKRRRVYMGTNTRRALWLYLERDRRSALPDEPLFVSVGGHEPGGAMSPSGVRQILKKAGEKARLRGVRCSPHTLAAGSRNDTGFWLACQLRDNAVPRDEVEEVLLRFQEQVPEGDHPYTEREARDSLEQAYGRTPREPWLTNPTPAKNENLAARPGTAFPRVLVTNRRPREMADEVVQILARANDPPQLSVRRRQLVRVIHDGAGYSNIEVMAEVHLRGHLNAVADFQKMTGGMELPVEPPDSLARELLARGSWPFPALEGICRVPILRPDGTILDRPGYDRQMRLVYAPSSELEGLRVPEHPSSEEVHGARSLIDELLADFPYVDPASRTNAMALLLTPFIRPAIDGPVPLALLEAPRRGRGSRSTRSSWPRLPRDGGRQSWERNFRRMSGGNRLPPCFSPARP